MFLKSNRVTGMDNRITVILAHLRGGVAGIYAQKKLDEFDEDNDTQDWDEFVKEFKTTFMLWQPLDTKSNDHTSNKSRRWISSGKFTRELDKEPLLN